MRVEIDEAGKVKVFSTDPRVIAEVERAVAAILSGDYEIVDDEDEFKPERLVAAVIPSLMGR